MDDIIGLIEVMQYHAKCSLSLRKMDVEALMTYGCVTFYKMTPLLLSKNDMMKEEDKLMKEFICEKARIKKR
jgi:hypothetical protein